jgi:U3 small nucleolar ribonucleoprotein protein LCP5
MSKQVESVDELLKGIITSLDVTKTSIESILKASDSEGESYPDLIQNLLQKLNIDKLEGVSLLSLKSHSLLSYLNNLVLIILAHVEKLSEEDDNIEDAKLKSIANSITQRVCLEKGIKPLEKKLNYQLDKMVRAYNRMEADESQAIKTAQENNENNEQGSNADDDESSEEEDDALSYRPDSAALAKLTQSKSKSSTSREPRDEEASESAEKYKPPKISAMAPPKADPTATGSKSSNTRKLQSMEEYLRENSDLPQLESSIGSTIVDNGRLGVKTDFDKKKEREIQRYEEDNFTRLPNTMTKKSFQQKQRDMAHTFAGEDWSMFNNSRKLDETSRKRKPGSVWDKVKKRRS